MFQPKVNPFTIHKMAFKMIDGDFKWLGVGVCNMKTIEKKR
jgi:hypothetical protein